MPTRYIVVPEAVTLLEPISGKPIPEADGRYAVWDFVLVVNKLMSNPMWAESFAAMRSQDAIYQALADMAGGVMALPEEDWHRLKQAVEHPKSTISTPMGHQTVPGYGLHPSLARQIVPLLMPIIEAKTDRPKTKPIAVAADPAAKTEGATALS